MDESQDTTQFPGMFLNVFLGKQVKQVLVGKKQDKIGKFAQKYDKIGKQDKV